MTLPEVEWAVAHSAPDCPADQVHVWLAALTRSGKDMNQLRNSLSRDELDRATRMLRLTDRERFVAAHGILRDILSRYFGNKPESLTFSVISQGKPTLSEGGVHFQDLRFNMSHSHDFALYVIAQNREVGIDLEYIHRTLDCKGLGRRFFSQQEFDTLTTLSGEQQARRFFEYWTCREAFLKMRGTGLRFPLSELQVVLSTHGDVATIQCLSADLETGPCEIRRFVPLKDFVGAVAIEESDLPVTWWRWEPRQG